jgi:hypothetical protein
MVSNTLRGARRAGLAVELLDARVDQLERRHHVVGRVQHVDERQVRPAHRAPEDERERHLDPRHQVARRLDLAAVAQQHPVVWLGDLRGDLHRPRCQPDLVPDHAPALGPLELHPLALDRVAVVDRHRRMAAREVRDRDARAFRGAQLGGERGVEGGVEHGGLLGSVSDRFLVSLPVGPAGAGRSAVRSPPALRPEYPVGGRRRQSINPRRLERPA